MKIILVGGGKVGFALCRSLVAEKHDVLLIEQDEAVLNHIVSRFDIIGILGNGADFAILEQASVQDCDIFIALTEHDEVNMIAAVLAKKMGAKETIVRVRNPEYSNSYFKEKNILGFSLIVNPELLAARAIANIIDFPNAPCLSNALLVDALASWNLSSSPPAVFAKCPFLIFVKNLVMSLSVR